MNTREDDVTRNMLDRIRAIRGKAAGTGWGIIKEEKESEKEDTKKTDAIAITDEPKFGTRVLSSQIESFRMQVESGVFSGTIPALNNLKWQFVLETNTGSGCFVWANGLIINKDNIQILNKLFGYYQNWREQWRTEAGDLDRMVRNIKENG